MMGVTWKGSGLVSGSQNAEQSIGFGPGEFAPRGVLGLRTYAGFYLYFCYASAFGRGPAPGLGRPG